MRIIAIFIPMFAMLAAAQPAVHVEADVPSSPRPLEQATEQAVVRDYIQSWQSMQAAFQQSRAGLLDDDFVGDARQTLSMAVNEQATLGLRTHYQDTSHNIKILFYSPEGLSVELVDTVKYNLQLFDHGHLISTRQESARYLVVMTPSQVRWRVRVFQGSQT
jgi:hypothetical protein